MSKVEGVVWKTKRKYGKYSAAVHNWRMATDRCLQVQGRNTFSKGRRGIRGVSFYARVLLLLLGGGGGGV